MIVCDIHEPKEICYLISKYGVKASLESLPIGDYKINDKILVERKTVNDLLSSTYNGRIFNQLKSLSSLESKTLLIIEGDIEPFKYIRTSRRSVRVERSAGEMERMRATIDSVAATAYLSYNIPFYFCRNRDHVAKFLVSLHKRASSIGTKLKPLKLRKKHDIVEIKSDMLCCIPSIGRKLGDYLAKNYSIRELCDLKDHSSIEGLGEKRLELLLKVLNS